MEEKSGQSRPSPSREKLDRSSREKLRDGEQEVLQSIARGCSLESTLNRLARVVEEVLPDGVCTVLLLDADGTSVRHGASPSVSDVFRQAIDGESIGPKAGSCGTAMYTDRPVISEDISIDPKWDPWRPVAEAEGLRACWSMPIHDSDARVIGSFAVYYGSACRPKEFELTLISRLRNLAGIAIERARVSEELHHREAIYRATFEQAAVGITHVAPDGQYLEANPRFCDLVGYDREELLGMTIKDLTHPDDLSGNFALIDDLLSGRRESVHIEKRYRHRDGHMIWVNLAASTVRLGNGLVERFVVVTEDVTEARKLSEELSYQARHDLLTGLINRHEFERRLGHFLEEVADGQMTGAIFYMDLDQFKLVNDTAGHVAGDELLRQLSHELLGQIRNSDVLSRLGGDEFGVLLRGCDIEDALVVAEKIQRAVEAFSFAWANKKFRIGVSIGVVALGADSLPSPTEVLQAADTACYMGKEQGRNKVVVWREDDDSVVLRHGEMQWIPRLNRALEEDRVVLMAQPIISLHDPPGTMEWYEILIRLRGDDDELIEPGAFLPAAERYGLAPQLDQHVVSSALAWFDRHKPGGRLPKLSINLSGASLNKSGFCSFLTAELSRSEDYARQLNFEITETAAISNLTDANRTMTMIREFGCTTALDDFGSGLSSFAYLKNLSMDYLKIDGVFVRDIADDPFDLAIISSIQEVSRVMDKKTIAEYVESEAIFRELQRLGVDYAQGYWVGPPVPLESIR